MAMYNQFFSEDTPEEGLRDSGPSPHPFLYDADDDDDMSFGVMFQRVCLLYNNE